jgi:hypothetical protein
MRFLIVSLVGKPLVRIDHGRWSHKWLRNQAVVQSRWYSLDLGMNPSTRGVVDRDLVLITIWRKAACIHHLGVREALLVCHFAVWLAHWGLWVRIAWWRARVRIIGCMGLRLKRSPLVRISLILKGMRSWRFAPHGIGTICVCGSGLGNV